MAVIFLVPLEQNPHRRVEQVVFQWLDTRLLTRVDLSDFGSLYADPGHQASLVEDKSVNPLLHCCR